MTPQTDPTGFKTTFNYCVNAAAGDCMNAATGTGYVTVTDPDGNATIYDYDQGALTAERPGPAGTALASEQDFFPTQTAAGTSGGHAARHRDSPTATATSPPTPTTRRATPRRPSPRTAIGTQTGTTTDSYTALNQVSCDGDRAGHRHRLRAARARPAPVAPGGVITAAVVGAAAAA